MNALSPKIVSDNGIFNRIYTVIVTYVLGFDHIPFIRW